MRSSTPTYRLRPADLMREANPRSTLSSRARNIRSFLIGVTIIAIVLVFVSMLPKPQADQSIHAHATTTVKLEQALTAGQVAERLQAGTLPGVNGAHCTARPLSTLQDWIEKNNPGIDKAAKINDPNTEVVEVPLSGC